MFCSAMFNLHKVSWKLLVNQWSYIIGWQNLNLLSYPSATLEPQARQARAIGEILNYVTLAPQARQARQWWNFELLTESDILVRSLTDEDVADDIREMLEQLWGMWVTMSTIQHLIQSLFDVAAKCCLMKYCGSPPSLPGRLQHFP